MKPWVEKFATSCFQRSPDIAHDLKTPLNIAVLNLELLRMRARKLCEVEEDSKLEAYSKSIEMELRRIAQIADVFFVLSIPPKGDPEPEVVDIVAMVTESAARQGIAMNPPSSPLLVECHPARIRELFRLVCEAGVKLALSNLRGDCRVMDHLAVLTLEGGVSGEGLDTTKVFKFYYTDPSGNPELSLASARLIAETYGGGMTADENEGRVKLTLTLPLSER